MTGEYIRKRIEIGIAHVRVHLPLRTYLGSYRILFDLLLKKVVHPNYKEDEEKMALISAINKILYFDQSLGIEAYHLLAKRDLEEKNLKLEQLNNQINRFVGMVVHDLRSPLNGIVGFSELTMLSNNLDQETRENVNFILKSSNNMLQIVDELLDLSALDSGELNLEKKKVNLALLIDEACKSVAPFALKKEIEIQIDSDAENNVEVDIDRLKMCQVLENLLSNAIKYSRYNSVVNISVDICSNQVNVGVHDNGVGIPDDEQDKVFTAFGQTSTKPTAGESSTGLRLFIVKKIVEAHGGNVWFDSREGDGSNFYFSLPKNRDRP